MALTHLEFTPTHRIEKLCEPFQIHALASGLGKSTEIGYNGAYTYVMLGWSMDVMDCMDEEGGRERLSAERIAQPMGTKTRMRNTSKTRPVLYATLVFTLRAICASEDVKHHSRADSTPRHEGEGEGGSTSHVAPSAWTPSITAPAPVFPTFPERCAYVCIAVDDSPSTWPQQKTIDARSDVVAMAGSLEVVKSGLSQNSDMSNAPPLP